MDPMFAEGLGAGPDGVVRCAWALSPPDYLAYHDDEWGHRVHGEQALYERLTLESFQSGLSWLTILRKREHFRRAFHGFDPEVIAGFGEPDRDRLLADPGIVRNGAKIDAAIGNARAVVALRNAGGLDALIWSFAPAGHTRPARLADAQTTSPESTALAKALRAKGFRFVGPTTAYSVMQACGLVDGHIAGCHRSPQ